MNALLIGDSHITALLQAHRAMQARGELAQDVTIALKRLGGGHILPTPFFSNEGDFAKITNSEYKLAFRQLPPKARRFGTLGLSMPLWPLRVMYQLVAQKISLETSVDGLRPMSLALFERLVLEDQKYVIELIEILHRSGTRVIAVAPPSLFRDHPIMSFHPANDALKMFATYQKIMTTVMERSNVHVIQVPERCLDAEGFMLAKYRHKDPKDSHHANAVFGKIMIREVEMWLRTRPAEADEWLEMQAEKRAAYLLQNSSLAFHQRLIRKFRQLVR
ncbi:hypothetical protein K3759_01250 [Sulfitobacter sp. W027]|uniref:hypothetical protein n=1 Tax=Sulfitobacter sp. W027 TaxID=2867025 RepID=UPI0021A373F2|nr:hypothetical protein [Sulfitobacter sp. W027]UWR33753.1 hypothetical protein K3759_01250 [Sulfitobacter sp. W027]